MLTHQTFKQFSKIKNVGVVGGGQMGTGIAIVANVVAGFNVKIVDQTEEKLINSKIFSSKWMEKEIAKERMKKEDMFQYLDRFSYSQKLEDLKDCDLVVEAVFENFDLKKQIFQDLDKFVKKDGILASNTSSISITKLAGITKRPEQVIGMHFMNPVPVMKLIEVIKGLQTSQETMSTIKEIATLMKKETVLSEDYPGFIANRILMPYINEAVYALYEKIASVEDIDNAMKMGTNVPMGPLTLADFIGLDTCLSIMKVLHEEFGDSKYRPCPLLQNYVNAGYLGKKSGRGFYNYKK